LLSFRKGPRRIPLAREPRMPNPAESGNPIPPSGRAGRELQAKANTALAEAEALKVQPGSMTSICGK